MYVIDTSRILFTFQLRLNFIIDTKKKREKGLRDTF